MTRRGEEGWQGWKELVQQISSPLILLRSMVLEFQTREDGVTEVTFLVYVFALRLPVH